MKATFENSISVLVKAFFDDTLQHGNCYACAIGNLVASANGFKYVPCIDEKYQRLALDVNKGRYLKHNPNEGIGGNWFDGARWTDHANDKAIQEMESIGYSWTEINRIERAFETAEMDGDYMFNGLMAVVDVLADIHGVDLTTKETAIGQFKEVQLSKA